MFSNTESSLSLPWVLQILQYISCQNSWVINEIAISNTPALNISLQKKDLSNLYILSEKKKKLSKTAKKEMQFEKTQNGSCSFFKKINTVSKKKKNLLYRNLVIKHGSIFLNKQKP